jgi:hypothetical protein
VGTPILPDRYDEPRLVGRGGMGEIYAECNLGRTLAELDRCDEAREHLERSKQLQGNREEIKAAKHLCAPGQRA